MTTTSTPTTTPFRANRAWRNAVFVIFALSGLDIASWLGRIPSVRDSLHASTFEIGLLALGISVGSISGLTAAGSIVAHWNARRGVQIASACLVIGMVLASLGVTLGWGFWPIAISLIAFGFGNGLLDVSMNVSGAAVERRGGRTVMPLFHASFSLGTLAGAGISSLAEAWRVPVALQIGVTGVLASVALLVAMTRFGDEQADAAEAGRAADDAAGTIRAPESRWAVWRSPATLLIGVIVLGMALAEGTANDWLALAMVDGHGLTNAEGTAVFTVFVAAMTASRAIGVVVIDRFGRVPVLRTSAVLAAVGLVVLIVVPIVPIAIAGVVLWGFGAAIGFPVGMSAAADDPRRAPARVSAVATVGYLAFLGGPPLIGFAGQHVGLLHALLIALVFIVAAGLVSGAAREPRTPTGTGGGTAQEGRDPSAASVPAAPGPDADLPEGIRPSHADAEAIRDADRVTERGRPTN